MLWHGGGNGTNKVCESGDCPAQTKKNAASDSAHLRNTCDYREFGFNIDWWMGGSHFFTGILLPFLLWVQVLRQSVLRNVQISVEEILGCGEDGINIRIEEIDRGDLFGSHSEWILCPRERVAGLVTYEESRVLEIVGRPIFYFQKGNEELRLDTADEFDEDYVLRFFCSEDNYLQILHLVQRGIQRIAVKREE